MDEADTAQERLLELLHRLNFARRWYDLCAAGRTGTPARRSAADISAALESTGRVFRYDSREQFYATREENVPGELGVNLCLKHGVAEFILVIRVPAGHIAGSFSGLMRNVEEKFGPALPPEPPYPQPSYRGSIDLRGVLAQAFDLYEEVAAAVVTSGLLG